VAFELSSAEREVKESFVLNLPLNGAPTDRGERILASIISNRAAFIRFLAMLLQEGPSEGSGADGADVFRIRKMLRTGGIGDMPLAECLLKAYCRTPEVFKEISRMLAAVDGAAGVVPEDFKELWAGFAPLVGGLK